MTEILFYFFITQLSLMDVGSGSKTQDVVDFYEPRHTLLKCNITQ
jgi:hypothetical protein